MRLAAGRRLNLPASAASGTKNLDKRSPRKAARSRGLINSTRNNDYAYRIYDETVVKRLEQILTLRKLNISVKDILEEPANIDHVIESKNTLSQLIPSVV